MVDKNKLEFFLFTFFIKVFRLIGFKNTQRFAKVIGSFLYYIIPIRKRTVISNLYTAFPEKNRKEIKYLTRKTYQNITITFFELMCVPFLSKETILSSVKFVNLDLIKNKLKSGKGLMILSGHFGSWEFVIQSLSVALKKPLNVLVKQQRNPYLTRWLEETRERFGNKVIPLGVSIKSLFRILQNGEIVFIAGDQRGHINNPRFNFFNYPTVLYTGAASIALRTKSNVIMVVGVRQTDHSYKVYSEELSFDNLPDDEEKKVYELTQRYISFLEKHVKNNPEQYFWMHKIWKY